MAGFAIVMTILTYGFFALLAACITSLCLYFWAKRRLIGEGLPYRRVAVASAVAPFLALLWLVASLIIHVGISNGLAHQDCGFSPDPYVTLPNGYVVGSHNTYDGYLSAPGFKTDVPVEGPGYVRSIIDLQLSNGYFIGTQADLKTYFVRHFVFDTRTRAFQAQAFQTSDTKDTNDSSGQTSSTIDKESLDRFGKAMTSAQDDATGYWKLYAHYRHQWPSYVLLLLISAGECAIGLWLWKLWTTV
jgi:hypothetical protein